MSRVQSITLRVADESRDDMEVADMRIPVSCVVNGHEFQENEFRLAFCVKCGQDQHNEIATAGAQL
jgi:hypothetical protein